MEVGDSLGYDSASHGSFLCSVLQEHWWAVLLGILALGALMASTVFIFGKALDSEEGNFSTSYEGLTASDCYSPTAASACARDWNRS